MYNNVSMVTCSGSPATTNCEPRQIRKEATVTVTSGAGVWLEQVAAYFWMLWFMLKAWYIVVNEPEISVLHLFPS